MRVAEVLANADDAIGGASPDVRKEFRKHQDGMLKTFRRVVRLL